MVSGVVKYIVYIGCMHVYCMYACTCRTTKVQLHRHSYSAKARGYIGGRGNVVVMYMYTYMCVDVNYKVQIGGQPGKQ